MSAALISCPTVTAPGGVATTLFDHLDQVTAYLAEYYGFDQTS